MSYFFSGRQNLISRISGSRPTENIITATVFRRLPTLSDRRTVPSPPGRTALYRTCPACLIVLIHLGLQNLSNILYASVKLSACTCHTPGTPLRCRMPGILSNRRMRCTQGGTGVGPYIPFLRTYRLSAEHLPEPFEANFQYPDKFPSHLRLSSEMAFLFKVLLGCLHLTHGVESGPRFHAVYD